MAEKVRLAFLALVLYNKKDGKIERTERKKEVFPLEKIRADLLIRDARVYNSYFKAFDRADVSILDGKFFYIDRKRRECYDAAEEVDGRGRFMVPGLIDIHMHIESSMMTPAAFCDCLAGCGVTTIVSEPHEMANVNGVEGILDMIRAGENSPVDVFYGIPSCVPSTSPELETTGGVIRCADMERLKENPAVACVGEVMNYRQIIRENDLEIAKFLKSVRKSDRAFPIEGHCPALLDLDLAKFLYLGINGDHTEHSVEELRQRFAGGMFVEIQEKMLHKEVLELIEDNDLYEHFCFVTDDVMADTLMERGHLDAVLRGAVSLGMKPERALYNATYTPARRMNLLDRGAIDPGKLADFVLLDDLASFAVSETYKRGVRVFQKGAPPVTRAVPAFPDGYYHSIQVAPKTAEDFRIRAEGSMAKVRVMEIRDGSTKTVERVAELPVENGVLRWEGKLLLAAVFERYGKTGGAGFGFLTGDCHKRGAVAASYAHDCHNVLVAGATGEDMAMALNRVIGLQGGYVAVENGRVLAELRLNVGGILSDRPAGEVGAGLAGVRAAMNRLGYRHYNPIMSFATVTLPVSPELKLTDKGLVDVREARVVPLFA